MKMKNLWLTFIITLLSVNICSGNPVVDCSDSVKKVFESMWFGGVPKKETEIAISACIIPAKNGDLESQFDLSLLYFFQNNENESKESYYWLSKAAKRNHSYAMHRLATIYENGKIVQKNEKEADHWFTKAAERGFLLTQKHLGKKYTSQSFSKEKYFKGIYWLKAAADQGDKLSIIELINIYSKGSKFIKPDNTEVQYWNMRYEKIF